MNTLRERVISYNTEVKAALQAVYSDLNQGATEETAAQSRHPRDV